MVAKRLILLARFPYHQIPKKPYRILKKSLESKLKSPIFNLVGIESNLKQKSLLIRIYLTSLRNLNFSHTTVNQNRIFSSLPTFFYRQNLPRQLNLQQLYNFIVS